MMLSGPIDVTLVGEVLTGYQDRKLAEVCTYPGCKEPPCDDCNECQVHRARSAARKRRSRRRQLAEWRRKKLCLRCGEKRRRGSKWCFGCLTKAGKLKTPERDKQRDNSPEPGWDLRMEQSPDGKLRPRRRWRGRAKRGRQSIAQLDAQDAANARRRMERGFDLLANYQTDEAKQLPKAQRDDLRDDGMSELRAAQRWLEEIIDRNSPKSRKPLAGADDE